MRMFDAFIVEDCDGQVKLYDRVMDSFSLDEVLPDLVLPFYEEDLPEDYAIKLRYGGWVVVKNKVFFKYQKEPPCLVYLYDKWGTPLGF